MRRGKESGSAAKDSNITEIKVEKSHFDAVSYLLSDRIPSSTKPEQLRSVSEAEGESGGATVWKGSEIKWCYDKYTVPPALPSDLIRVC